MTGEELLELCARMTNDELFEGLGALDDREAGMLARILAHIGTLESRKAAGALSYASMFRYCTQRLGYSEAEAYLRIRAARAACDYPRILTMIARREIHVTAVARIAPHLTSENYRCVLAKAARRTQEELERLIAELGPTPETRPVIRTISAGSNATAQAPRAEASLFDSAKPAAPQAGPGPTVSPLSDALAIPEDAKACSPRAPAGRVLFKFVASEALRAKFKLARELLFHKYPRGLPEEIFDDALEALLDRKDPWRRIARIEARRRRAPPTGEERPCA